MGINPAPQLRFYWNKDKRFRIPGIADAMTRDRFELIKRFLYFNDLEEAENPGDSLRKLRTIYESISKACLYNWKGEAQLSVDESMIPFSGDHSGSVYIPRKPIKNEPIIVDML